MQEHTRMTLQSRHRQGQRGITLFGLVFWVILVGFLSLVALRAIPTVSEYWTVLRAVSNIAQTNPATVLEVRTAFDKQRQVETGIVSVEGKDLEVTKENDRVVVSFAYDKEIELFAPVYLLIKYRGEGRAGSR